MRAEILDRISESEVHEWLKAKLKEIRTDGLPIHALQLDAHLYRLEKTTLLETSITMHALGQCVVSQPSIATATANLARELGDKQGRVKKLKDEAAKLLSQAAELEGK